ncbi:MAG: argininosuccinate lyase [Gammaproteobacteria bacterium]
MAKPLWQSNDSQLDERIMRFLAGNDVLLDQQLFVFDVQASVAHVKGLGSIGVLEDAEVTTMCEALVSVGEDFVSGKLELTDEFEDGHSAIEHWVTERAGDLGGKIHTGRSRNDQVLVATRLYLLDRLSTLKSVSAQIAAVCLNRADESKNQPMPGYTHLQRAVVSSVGMWFAGFAEAFVDNAWLAQQTSDWVSCNPLGTAAGYGVNLPLDRELTTQELGFGRMQVNPVYAQNSRGKFELQALSALSQALLDVRRLAWDLSLFTTAEFNFVSLPETYTTGSSIMPNKRNPDVIELLRGAFGTVQGAMTELTATLSLPSGYQRDLQNTKGPMLRATEHAIEALQLVPALLQELKFHPEQMENAFDRGMFATDMAVELAASNIPFRQAYRLVKDGLDEITDFSPLDSLQKRTSPGASADLRLDLIQARLDELAV